MKRVWKYSKSAAVLVAIALVCGLGLSFMTRSYPQVVSGQTPGGDDYKLQLARMKRLETGLTRSKTADKRIGQLRQKVAEQGQVRVIVRVRASFEPEGNLARQSAVKAQRFLIKEASDRLIENLHGYDPNSVGRYESLPYLVLSVNVTGLESLWSSDLVLDIQEDMINRVKLKDSTRRIGAINAWRGGARGNGQTIAIIDTGVDKNHPFLASKVVSEACYSKNIPDRMVQSVCPGGVERAEGPNTGLPCSSDMDSCAHGTHVAGIAAGRGNGFSGVAPDANIIAIQVFTTFNSPYSCSPERPPCLGAFDSDILSGLQRVYDLRTTFNIAAVNMSLGGSIDYITNCDQEKAVYKAVIDNLRSVGIATVVASGNEVEKDKISAPACISSTISVGATSNLDGLPEDVEFYSNSSPLLTLLAPGGSINSSVPGGGFDVKGGTSMAAPHVAGAFALLRSVSSQATVSRLTSALTSTGVGIRDSGNNLVKPRIQVDRAIASLGPVLIGNLDRADCNLITGWAADRNKPDVAISVKIFDGNSLVATVPANQLRQDVATVVGDQGYHGFSINTPAVFRDGKPHTIRVQFESSPQNIPNGQKSVTCLPVYAGNVDRFDCNYIVGWAADRNRPNLPITVRIYDGERLVTTVTAQVVRADIAAHLGDNGAHGFTIPTPDSLRDGKPHAVRIRYENSDTNLSNGSKSLNCSPVYVGNLEAASCSTITGWAADRNRLDQAITVRLFDGEKLVQTLTANLLRQDVGSALGDNGRHGFSISTPSVFRDGKQHTLRLRFENGSTSLSNSPKTLQCSR